MAGNRRGNTLLIKTFSHFILGLPSVEQDCNRGYRQGNFWRVCHSASIVDDARAA
jgi:hypothetical protein